MSAIIAPSEPQALRDIGTTALIAESYGADILIPAPGYFIGVQRKVFPGDFLSSLYDGRLSTSLVKLTKCDVRILVLEGRANWTTSGFLMTNDFGYQFSRTQLRNLCLSAQVELGIHTTWTDSLTDTIDYVRDLVRWGAKDRHDSLLGRPTPAKPLVRRQFTHRDRAVFFLQGFDGIGPELAGRIYDHFKRVPLALDDDGELTSVPGVGPNRVAKMRELLK